ncbi:MAG: DUF7133 domain-containing protein, partial [Opitutaceae bacterium]
VYDSGGRGIRIFENVLKVMVGVVVLSFFGVVVSLTLGGRLDWGAAFAGLVPDFSQLAEPTPALAASASATGENASIWNGIITDRQRSNIIAAAGAAVGINMTFLLPFSLLKRRWGRRQRGLAIFDLSIGLFIPFVVATSFLVIAAWAAFYNRADDVLVADGSVQPAMARAYDASVDVFLACKHGGEFASATPEARTAWRATLAEADRQMAAKLAQRDARQLADTLTPFLGERGARLVFGAGVLAMAWSTMIVHMLMNGLAFSALIKRYDNRKVFMIGALMPAIAGVLAPALWTGPSRAALAIPASVIATTLLPIAYFGFLLLMNSRAALGERRPRGGQRLLWNVLMCIATAGATMASVWALLNQSTAGAHRTLRARAPVRHRARRFLPQTRFAAHGCSMIVSRLLLAGLFLPASIVLAQQGDRPDDPQPDLPEHIVVPPAPALSVEEALQTFQLAPGFRIEVVASDPLVLDPVAMTIGPDGRIWVVEMRGFMRDVDGAGEDQPIGLIAVLSDTDGDGRMDHRTEFAGGFVLPRAIALVDGGLLVGEPPMLWWLRDTDGDGVADERKEVAGDYGARGNPEHTANGLLWALDNWIYSANHRTRFRYLGSGEWERDPTIGRGQWGITQDDTGRLYYNNNSLPLQIDLLPAEYLARNPDLTRPVTAGRAIGALRDIRVWPSRVTPGVNRGYKILDEEGKIREVTAACAPLIYRGGLFGQEFHGNAFICEPAGNLVKRLLVEPTADGDLRARNAYEGFEFLTSTDERFRPVNTAAGPDGALYIVDMYRGVIQHRNFVTTFLRKQIEERNLETPLGMGRIYRIVPEDRPAPRVRPRLHRASVDELVRALDHFDGWWRDTAQRLLVERGGDEAVPALRKLAADGSAHGRLHALWTLHGVGAVRREDAVAAMADEDAAVRAAGLRFAEPWLREGDENLVARAVALAEDPEVRVRRQAALSLGEAPGPAPLEALAKLAVNEGGIVGMSDAIVSGLREREVDFLQRLASAADPGAALPVAEVAVAAVVHRGDAAEISQVLAWLQPSETVPQILVNAALGGLERSARLRDDREDDDDDDDDDDGDGRRVELPVEPDTVAALAGQKDSRWSARAARLLPLLAGPSAQATSMAEPARPLTEEEQKRFVLGEAAYAVCAGCHHPEGVGQIGIAPSLVESKWAVGAEEALVRIVLHGKEGDTSLAMPPLGALDDATIAAVTTYIRRAWGHTADPVEPETVAAIRAAESGRDRAWSLEELERVARASSPAKAAAK